MPAAVAGGLRPEVDAISDRSPVLHEENGLWVLYWRDRHLKFHCYQFVDPSLHIQDLLDHIENGGDPIFWG
ncbi:DUF3024 domain-containing protein [Rhodococcus sp. 24CO]|uniref:DUF3024 domain-containing protein n=1 Tax=Rhodococcus sp. 24CO TaxID=3117460 RepID=UPI003D33ADB8